VSLDEIGDRAVRGVPFDGPVAAVTFDDGYQDVYDLGFPVLKRMGIPAAVFVVTDLVGRPSWQVHDRLYHLVAKAFTLWPAPGPQLSRLLRELDLPIATLPGYATSSPLAMISALLPQLARADLIRLMDALEARVGNGHTAIPSTLTWPMLETMRRAGFTIGSHTKSHVSLPTESTATAADELEGSKRELETRLGEPIQHFAYPGGHFTTNVVEALARAGYRYGYTACSHYDPRHPALTIERMVMWERTSTDAGGAFCPAVLGCQVHDRWPARCTRVHQA
jgi:peptidoglycan/xylan/chitin deacetylase (PgdA/CDA1 family)